MRGMSDFRVLVFFEFSESLVFLRAPANRKIDNPNRILIR